MTTNGRITVTPRAGGWLIEGLPCESDLTIELRGGPLDWERDLNAQYGGDQSKRLTPNPKQSILTAK